MTPTSSSPLRVLAALAAGAAIAPALVLAASPGQAASSDACQGGGFRLVNLATGATIAAATADAEVDRTIAASAFGPRPRFGVRGKYVGYDVRLSDFAVFDYAFTGAPNPEDMTGGRRTPVYKSKVPDHRGRVLSGGIRVELDEEEIGLIRNGTGLKMKIQSKDCAQGGIFQMEPEREDGTRTRIVHTLATSATPGLTPFYFDNPRFRAREGQFLGSACTSRVTGPPSRFCVQVSTRTNIGNDVSPEFVARDSAQVAERVDQPDCNTADPVRPSVEHCGGASVWDAATGGRMGFMSRADAVAGPNPPTERAEDWQAQNQVRG